MTKRKATLTSSMKPKRDTKSSISAVLTTMVVFVSSPRKSDGS